MRHTATRMLCGAVVMLLLGGSVVPVVATGEPLALDQCVRQALNYNLNTAQAVSNLKSAGADVTAARSVFLPNIRVSGSVSKPEETIEVFQGGELKFFDKTYSADAQASLVVFDGFGNLFGYRQATHGRTAAQERLLDAKQQVIYDTEKRYYEVGRTQELLDVAEKAAKLSNEQLKRTQAMKDLGASTLADVYKAEVDHSNARLVEIRAGRNLRVARASLAASIGLEVTADIEVEPLALEVVDVPFSLEEALTRAEQQNPGLRAARASLDSQKAGVKAAKSDRYPSLSIWGNTSYFNFEAKDFDDEHIEWRYGASVNLTVFDGMLTKSNIRRAESNQVLADRFLELEQLAVDFVVAETYADLEVAREAISVAQDGVRSSEEDLRLAQERFKIGEGTILDVVDAQVNLRRARSTLVTSRYDARLALAALRNAIGEVEIPGATN